MSQSADGHYWQLDPDVDFLNHGSFGATPTCVLEVQRRLRDQLEREPIKFLAPERELEPKIDAVRKVISQLVHADPEDLVFVRSATEGVNAVLRSFPFQLGDEVVISSHGYNACNNAAKYAAESAGALVRVAMLPIPLSDAAEIVAAVEAVLTNRTRLLQIDHVTSATGLVLPIGELISLARQRGIRVLVDGAHAPGMIPVDLQALDADYYTANHHKWLCAPKASGFLYVRRELHSEVRPTIISHGMNRRRPGRSQFHSEFDWMGTNDPTPLLSVPAAIEFLANLGGSSDLIDITAHTTAIRALTLQARQCLLDRLGIAAPAPPDMIGTMVTLPLPVSDQPSSGAVDPLQARLFEHHRIELPIFQEPNLAVRCLRISVQAYNQLEQYQRLGDALLTELSAAADG